MLIDTHCHLDANEFDVDRPAVIAAMHAAGVAGVVIPAVAPANFSAVRELAHSIPGGAYALGIHPLYIAQADGEAVAMLRKAVETALDDPRFVAVGEIGLDLFVPELAQGENLERQQQLFVEQLKLAAEFELPVILHVRRAQDLILKHLRRVRVPGGIAHAFNGSLQQAEMFVKLGMALGIGGAMTYARARQIRRIACAFDPSQLVLETDAPDIPPAWLEPRARNTPAEVAGVARALAELRGESEDAVIRATGTTAMRVLPRLRCIVHP